MDVIAIDQQGGKSNCGYAENVMMTLCSDSHGTPHAVCYVIEGNIKDPMIVCYDSRGNGEGEICPTLTGDHENRVTDYTSIVVIDHSRRHSYQALNVFPTMEAHMGTGGGNVPLVLIKGRGK